MWCRCAPGGVLLHASSRQGTADAFGGDGDRGGGGVDAFDEVVLCQVSERLVKVGGGNVGPAKYEVGVARNVEGAVGDWSPAVSNSHRRKASMV